MFSPVPLSSTNSKQHRTQIATAVNELQRNVQTGSTLFTDPLTATGLDDTTAIQARIDAGEPVVLYPASVCTYYISKRIYAFGLTAPIIICPFGRAKIVMLTGTGQFDQATQANKFGTSHTGIYFLNCVQGAVIGVDVYMQANASTRTCIPFAFRACTDMLTDVRAYGFEAMYGPAVALDSDLNGIHESLVAKITTNKVWGGGKHNQLTGCFVDDVRLVTGISTNHTLSGGGTQALTLNGELASGGAITFSGPRTIYIRSDGNDSARTITITGHDDDGNVQTETLAGANKSYVLSAKQYSGAFTSITFDGNTASTVSAGIHDSYGFYIKHTGRKITLGAAALASDGAQTDCLKIGSEGDVNGVVDVCGEGTGQMLDIWCGGVTGRLRFKDALYRPLKFPHGAHNNTIQADGDGTGLGAVSLESDQILRSTAHTGTVFRKTVAVSHNRARINVTNWGKWHTGSNPASLYAAESAINCDGSAVATFATGDGATTAFASPAFDQSDDMSVFVGDSLMVLGTDYTVSGGGWTGAVNSAGTVTFTSAPALNKTVQISSKRVPYGNQIDIRADAYSSADARTMAGNYNGAGPGNVFIVDGTAGVGGGAGYYTEYHTVQSGTARAGRPIVRRARKARSLAYVAGTPSVANNGVVPYDTVKYDDNQNCQSIGAGFKWMSDTVGTFTFVAQTRNSALPTGDGIGVKLYKTKDDYSGQESAIEGENYWNDSGSNREMFGRCSYTIALDPGQYVQILAQHRTAAGGTYTATLNGGIENFFFQGTEIS